MAHEPRVEGETEIAEAEKAGFDSVEAFNTAGFPEFLAKFPDAETFDVADMEALETRFNAFQKKNEAANGLGEVLEEELAEHELGIKFGDEAIERHVGERFDSLAIENPEKVVEIAEALEAFQTLKVDIAENQKKLAELYEEGNLEKALEELKKKKEILETAAEAGPGKLARIGLPLLVAYEKFMHGRNVESTETLLKHTKGGTYHRTREEMEADVKKYTSAQRQNEARLALPDYSVEFNRESIEEAIKQTEEEIKDKTAKIVALEDLEKKHAGDKAQFAEIKKMLVLGVGTNEELKKVAMEKVVDKLDKLLASDPNEAQLYFEKVKEISSNNVLGIDYLNGKGAEMQKFIESAIDVRLAKDMKETIVKTKFGNKAYDKMAKSIKGYLERLKVGTREGDDARAFVLETFKSIGAEIAKTDKAKALLIRFMHVQLQSVAA
jgi:tetratricopeptide (TPR) repeat protein